MVGGSGEISPLPPTIFVMITNQKWQLYRGGSAFRICLRQIHGSRRRARARVRGGFLCKSSDDGALFFAAFGDGGKKFFLPHFHA